MKIEELRQVLNGHLLSEQDWIVYVPDMQAWQDALGIAFDQNNPDEQISGPMFVSKNSGNTAVAFIRLPKDQRPDVAGATVWAGPVAPVGDNVGTLFTELENKYNADANVKALYDAVYPRTPVTYTDPDTGQQVTYTPPFAFGGIGPKAKVDLSEPITPEIMDFLTEYYKEKLDAALEPLKKEYPQDEILSWIMLVAEAQKVMNDPLYQSPMIAPLAAEDGVDEQTYSTKVLQKSKLYVQAVTTQAIARKRINKDMAVATTVGDVVNSIINNVGFLEMTIQTALAQ